MEINENFVEHYGLSNADLELTMKSYAPGKVKAKEYFLKEGQVSDKIGFVKSGILRMFIHDEDNNDITTQFFSAGSLIISFDSFNNQVPARENIVAMEDAELMVMTYPKLQELYQRVPVWQQICKDLADKKSQDMHQRSIQLQTLSATERYRQFCLDYPEVIQKVALRHVASYLGIDIATLSRIRKKM
jgi:CRP-like cAMP-binding protein